MKFAVIAALATFAAAAEIDTADATECEADADCEEEDTCCLEFTPGEDDEEAEMSDMYCGEADDTVTDDDGVEFTGACMEEETEDAATAIKLGAAALATALYLA